MKDTRLEMLFVFIFPLQILVTSQVPGCEDCKCCVNDTCALTDHRGYTVTDFCTYGCDSGITGNRCYNKCPAECDSCEQTNSDICITCKVGKYLTNLKRCVDCPETCTKCQTICEECQEQYYNDGQRTDCSAKCAPNCKKCTSSVNCQECYAPYYNQGDVTDCSLSCPGNCDCSSPGVCSACQDGYFNVNGQCDEACPVKCKTCSDQSTCQFCIDGYYNGIESINNIAVTNCSLPCRDTCVYCTTYDACTICKPGFYGSFCQYNCSVGCYNNECDREDGSCSCKVWFKGNNCAECEAGRHGKQCEHECPHTCKDNTCIRETGYCVECESVNIIGETCGRCVNKYWDTDCSSACPQNCDGDCERNSGYCILCKGNFQSSSCDDCISGFHGLQCDEECPKHCYDSNCYPSNGTCKQCNDNYAGPTCEACVAGMYGEKCDVPCLSIHCSGNTCDMDTGYCSSCPNRVYGLLCDLNCSSGCNDASCDFRSGACSECREHYTGDKCCLAGGHCRYCSSSAVCGTCDNGLFGEKCEQSCPKACVIDGQDLQCEKIFGKCLSCTNGFHGDYCNKTCSERCFNSRCDKDNGHCVDGCAGDYEGPTCAQAMDTVSIVGIAVGISSAIMFVMMIILISTVFLVLKRWKRKNKQGQEAHVSYVNAEFQPVIPDPRANVQTQQEYEELGAINEKDDTDYEQIKLQDSN